jgi:hypothetical protein
VNEHRNRVLTWPSVLQRVLQGGSGRGQRGLAADDVAKASGRAIDGDKRGTIVDGSFETGQWKMQHDDGTTLTHGGAELIDRPPIGRPSSAQAVMPSI